MNAKKIRWAKTYEAGEGELIDLLDAKHIEADRWIGEEFETFPPHLHDLDTRIWCAEGSVAYTVNGVVFPLQAGDALDIPAMAVHEASVGFAGCICYESPPHPVATPTE